MPETPQPLISVAELAELAGSDPAPIICDVRWSLGQTNGRERYLEGHIPGSRYVDLDSELASEPSPATGRHPLPSREDFQATLRALGVNDDSEIVVYDQAQSFGAARLWWMLRNAGFGRGERGSVRVLDGGLDAWIAAGYEVAVGNPGIVAPGAVTIDTGAMPVVEIDEVARLSEQGILLDARDGERYRGEVEPMDPRAGHIPGALSAPTTDNVDGSGAFRPRKHLRARFEGLGLDGSVTTAVYCGSGITAAHELLAMEVAGFSGALFPGSWSQWSSDPNRPAATGKAP